MRHWMNLFESDDFDDYEDEDEDSKFDALPASSEIKKLRPQLAAVGQAVYDEWEQGEDDELNGGGICHLIAEKMSYIIGDAGVPVWTVSSSHEQHVYCVAQCSDGVFEVDIPWSLYERGGGFTWYKLPNIRFDEHYVVVSRLDGNPGRIGQYVDDYEED
jgi:hypothetical protein